MDEGWIAVADEWPAVGQAVAVTDQVHDPEDVQEAVWTGTAWMTVDGQPCAMTPTHWAMILGTASEDRA